MDDGTTLTMRPAGTGFFSVLSGKGVQSGMSERTIPGGPAGESHATISRKDPSHLSTEMSLKPR